MGERVRRATAGVAVGSLGFLVLGGCFLSAPTPVDPTRMAQPAAAPWELVAQEIAAPSSVPGEPVALHAAAVAGSGRPFAEYPAQPRSEIDCRVVRCVALTFDDGPSEHTRRLLEFLARERVPATFFVLGHEVERLPDVARAAAARGEVGNHTWDHRKLTRLTEPQIAQEIHRTDAAVAAALGTRPRLLRPPYGAINDQATDVVRRAGLPIVLWSVDPEDWRHRNADAVHQRVMETVRPGSVVLLHDIYSSTVDAVPRIVADLKALGYTFVTVSQMWDDDLNAGVTYRGREAAWQGDSSSDSQRESDESPGESPGESQAEAPAGSSVGWEGE